MKFHYILIDFEAKPISSEDLELSPLSEVLEARCFTPEEMRDIPMTQTAKILLRKMGVKI